MTENRNRIVLCGANAYEQKYYFNEAFHNIPESIKEELHILCVLFTEEVGGVFTIVFEEDGSVSLERRIFYMMRSAADSWCGRFGCSVRNCWSR